MITQSSLLQVVKVQLVHTQNTKMYTKREKMKDISKPLKPPKNLKERNTKLFWDEKGNERINVCYVGCSSGGITVVDIEVLLIAVLVMITMKGNWQFSKNVYVILLECHQAKPNIPHKTHWLC